MNKQIFAYTILSVRQRGRVQKFVIPKSLDKIPDMAMIVIMRNRLPLLVICLLLLSTLVTAFHHHDDGADHPDCSICVATHQQADTGHTAPVYQTPRLSAETASPVCPVLPLVSKPVCSSVNDRAPPA